MIDISALTEYDGDIAATMGVLRRQLSTKYDGSPIPRDLIEEIIESPYHDILLAIDDNDKIVGMVVVSVVMMTTRRNVYMEDLVIDKECRGRGVGGQLLDAVKEWGKAHGCRRLEFTSSSREKKEGAKGFYESHGAEVRETNAFRAELL
jgi:ribosomal protein S18 acetylase RimI-like enzyme